MSVISVLTPQDFKDLFTRQFIYASVWNNATIYNLNDVVYYFPVNDVNNVIQNTFYRCLSNNVISEPSVITDWALLPGNGYILDSDITEAMAEASAMFNLGLFTNNQVAVMAFLYLTAHYLVIDFANTGLNSIGGVLGNITNRSVDDVSLGFGIPQAILNNPLYSAWCQTGYGAKAFQLMYPRIIGASYGIVCGRTTP